MSNFGVDYRLFCVCTLLGLCCVVFGQRLLALTIHVNTAGEVNSVWFIDFQLGENMLENPKMTQ